MGIKRIFTIFNNYILNIGFDIKGTIYIGFYKKNSRFDIFYGFLLLKN